MTATDIVPGKKLAEGKTKVIYEAHDDLAYMVHKDDITAGDGAKRDVISGKGALSCRTTSAVFRYLRARGIHTHYVDEKDERTTLVLRAEMLPIEWVARRIAAGSYVRRTGVPEGTRLEPLVLELFLKDDARHDPQITGDEAVALGLCSRDELNEGLSATGRVFLALEEAWAEQDITLVDLKIEFGRADGRLVVADVVDNDSWRLWPGGSRDRMLDKQVYRDLRVRDDDSLADVRARYVEVTDRVQRFQGA